MERTHYQTILLLLMPTKKGILITGSLASTVLTIFQMTETIRLWWNLMDISVLYPAGCPQNARHCGHSALLKCLPLHISLSSPQLFLTLPQALTSSSTLTSFFKQVVPKVLLLFHYIYSPYHQARTFNKIILGRMWTVTPWWPHNTFKWTYQILPVRINSFDETEFDAF